MHSYKCIHLTPHKHKHKRTQMHASTVLVRLMRHSNALTNSTSQIGETVYICLPYCKLFNDLIACKLFEVCFFLLQLNRYLAGSPGNIKVTYLLTECRLFAVKCVYFKDKPIFVNISIWTWTYQMPILLNNFFLLIGNLMAFVSHMLRS